MSNKKDFNIRHPEWQRMSSRWQFAFDFWRGGIHVLNPNRSVSIARVGNTLITESDNDDENPEIGRPDRAFSWYSMPSSSYIWKHERETLNQFSDRAERAIHFPLFQSVINIFTAGILRRPPKRGDVTPGEPWDTYWYDVDMNGTNIDAFIRQALGLALVFGRVHAITDMPYFTEPSLSKHDQIVRGERPYTWLLTPLDLVDWKTDENGRFLWAVIREDAPDEREPGTEINETANQYRVWYPDHWELYREQSGDNRKVDYILVGANSHPCNRVPISTLWATKDSRSANMCCESPIADVLDIDRHMLNKLSELDELERVQAFELLWLPEMDGAPMGPIDVSPFSAIVGSSDAGSPQYVGPNPSHAVNKLKRIEQIAHMARQLAGVGRGRAEYSKEERSAASMMVESEDKRNQMAWWSSAVSEFDKQIHRDVLAWEGMANSEFPEAEYPTDFDISGTFTKINELVMFNSIDQVKQNKEAMAMLLKPVFDRLLREHGVAPEDIQKALKAVDDGVEEAKKIQEEMRQNAMQGEEKEEIPREKGEIDDI